MHGRWIRGVVILAAAGTLGAALLASSVTAASAPATKQFVKKQVKKLRMQVQASFLHDTSAATVAGTVTSAEFHENVTVSCPAGKQAMSGGVEFPQAEEFADADVFIGDDHPVVGAGGFATGWRLGLYNYGPDDEPYTAYAVCAAPAA
jgi:hypothetical protein